MKVLRQVILAIGITAVIACSWVAPLDAPATEQVDAGLKRALVSFATARALNGFISVLQGLEISAQPLGFGVTLTPGQILAPVNELVKHFADMMLAASVAFGILKILISISAYWLVSLALTVVALGWAWFIFRNQYPYSWLSRILVVLLMARFAIPIVTVGTDALSQRFLAAGYAESHKAIDISSGQAASLNTTDQPDTANMGTFERLKDWLQKNMDLKARFTSLKTVVERTTAHIVKLIAIFLLETLIIPLVLLWGFYAVIRVAFEWPQFSRPQHGT